MDGSSMTCAPSWYSRSAMRETSSFGRVKMTRTLSSGRSWVQLSWSASWQTLPMTSTAGA